jgi:putative membrane protein
MRGILTEEERARVDEGIEAIERRTRAQIVVAVVERSDSYAELPWKAFAFGASITCLVILALGFLAPYRASLATGLVAMAGMLAFGGLCALLTVLMPGFARLFLSRYRSEAEVRQYAESLFLKREVFATAERTGILLLVSLFEGQAVLLPDRGLAGPLTGDAVGSIVGSMVASLSRGRTGEALERGLGGLLGVLEGVWSTRSGGPAENELSNEVIEEKSA